MNRPRLSFHGQITTDQKPPQAKRAFDLISYAIEKMGLSRDKDAAYALRILETKARHAVGKAPKLAKRKATRKILRLAGVTPKTKSDWLRDADMWFSRFIRLRDSKIFPDGERYSQCRTCIKLYHISDIENGHWIRRENWGTRFDERNCNAQGPCCNHFKGGAEHAHEQYIANKYGKDMPEKLRVLAKNKKCKPTAGELEQIANHYQTKVTEMGGWPQ